MWHQLFLHRQSIITIASHKHGNAPNWHRGTGARQHQSLRVGLGFLAPFWPIPLGMEDNYSTNRLPFRTTFRSIMFRYLDSSVKFLVAISYLLVFDLILGAPVLCQKPILPLWWDQPHPSISRVAVGLLSIVSRCWERERAGDGFFFYLFVWAGDKLVRVRQKARGAVNAADG